MNSSAAEQSHAEALRHAAAGRLREAIEEFEAALRHDPKNPLRHYNLARAWQQSGSMADAVRVYADAGCLAPGFFEVWCNLAVCLKELGKIDEAMEAGRQATCLRPGSAAAWINLGNAQKAAHDLLAAESSYRQASSLEPENPKAALNLANTLREEGRVAEAIPLLREAVRRHPNHPEAHRDLAFALLISGNLEEGWIENEWRWRTDGMVGEERCFGVPKWNGESLEGRSILIHAEQGFGDSIQFVRYAPMLAERGAQVFLECQPALARLFQSVDRVAVFRKGDPLPPFDFHLPMLSLPRIFKTTLETIPAKIPYLGGFSPAPEDFPEAAADEFRAGLVWAGNPLHVNDARRSLPFEAIRLLIDELKGSNSDGSVASRRRSLRLFSLQTGPRASEWGSLARDDVSSNLSPWLVDFAAAASVVKRLDWVITVDTSMAHLAGALGKPVSLLLPSAPDWRWLLGRDDSPWYPTVRLFRQKRPGDWGSPITRIVSQRQTSFTPE